MPATPSQDSLEAVYDLPHDERLGRLIADARLLLSYVVRGAGKLDTGLVEEITDVCHAMEHLLAHRDGTDALRQMEKCFLVLYGQLSSIAAPVTAQSIRHTMAASRRRFLGSTTIASVVALLVFALVVIAQGYWVVGKRFKDQLQRLESRKQEQVVKNLAAEDGLWHVDQRKQLLNMGFMDCQDSDESASPPPRTDRAAALRARKCAQDATLDEERVRLLLSQRPTLRELKDVADQTTPIMTVMSDWYTLGSRFVSDETWLAAFRTEEDRIKKEIDARRAELTARQGTPTAALTPLTRLRNESAMRRLDAEQESRIQAIEQRKSRVLIHRVDINLDIVQNYLVPSLLGLLGALVFVLRDTSMRLKAYAYVADSAARGVGRVVVGMMAGVLGGWFVPNVDSVAKSVPPLIIPFVFGYSVELLFGLLDRAVGAFSSSKTP